MMVQARATPRQPVRARVDGDRKRKVLQRCAAQATARALCGAAAHVASPRNKNYQIHLADPRPGLWLVLRNGGGRDDSRIRGIQAPKFEGGAGGSGLVRPLRALRPSQVCAPGVVPAKGKGANRSWRLTVPGMYRFGAGASGSHKRTLPGKQPWTATQNRRMAVLVWGAVALDTGQAKKERKGAGQGGAFS